MEMKWHPIVNGDLSGIQQQETLLFTIFDERQNENYVTTGWILENEGELQVRGVDPWGLNSNKTKKVKAWMELPSPFHPNDCNMCAHYMEATDRTLGELIKTMRKAEGVTKGELAIAVYSCTSFITRWENGEDISWFKFLEIAKELGYCVEIKVSVGTEL